MVAIGDSITRAMNPADERFGDQPHSSWATGSVAGDGIVSHLERLSLLVPDIGERSLSVARSGARMSDFERQARAAVAAEPEYVTVLLGANDACASSVASMTEVETFRAQFRAGAQVLAEELPEGARVYVLSVPDVTALWDVAHEDQAARWVWGFFGICPSVLDSDATEADRAAVRARVVAYNGVLAEESARFGFAHDGGAVFEAKVRPEDVSSLDYFHPSLAGQARLAEASWAAGPWGQLPIDVAAAS